MTKPRCRTRIGENSYVVDLETQKSLHAFWVEDASPYVTYYLGVSDGSAGLPHDKRTIDFVSYGVDEVNPTPNSIGELRAGKEALGIILKSDGLIRMIHGIPVDEQPFFNALLEELRVMMFNQSAKWN